MILQRIIIPFPVFDTFNIPSLHITNENIVYYFRNKSLKRVYYRLQIQKPFSHLLKCPKRFFRLLTSENLLQCMRSEDIYL